MAEDHSFGLIKGSAARLSEHGQLCRLDSDGLCSAGPRMEPSSGCYRIEFEVLQAGGPRGAGWGGVGERRAGQPSRTPVSTAGRAGTMHSLKKYARDGSRRWGGGGSGPLRGRSFRGCC